MRRLTGTVAICALLALHPGPAAAQVGHANPIYRVILGPGADETAATVSWRTRGHAAEELRFYPTANPGSMTAVAASEQDNGALLYRSMESTMTGLAPETDYTYQVGSDAAGWSEPFHFRTGSFARTWDFLAFADPQIGVNLKNAEQGAAWRRTVETATREHPSAQLMLSLGDQVDGWGLAQPQYDEFFSPGALRSIPTAAIAGNHETYWFGQRHFEEHFSLPNEVADTGNYSFTRNNSLFIALNSNQASAADIERHSQFLRRVVAEQGGGKDWVVLSFHHGPFSQASHARDKDVAALRAGLTPVISELGIDVVLSGHDHLYARSHLMKGTEPVVPASRAQVGDVLTPGEGEVLYITTTTAGGGKYYDFTDVHGTKHPGAQRENIDPALENPWTALWQQDYTPDYLHVAASPSELVLTTHNAADSSVVDQVTLRK